jgi:hypothetical protein
MVPGMTEQEIEERVARAICVSYGDNPNHWESYKRLAREHVAAIAEYRRIMEEGK